jgi:hypothetical protein
LAGIQLAAGHPSVTSQPGVPLGTQGYFSSAVNQRQSVDEEGSPIEVLTELANGFFYCGYFCQSTNMVTA